MVTEPDARATFAPVLAAVAEQIRALKAQIAATIVHDPLWTALDRSFRTLKGVVDRTVAHLTAEMPEIGTLTNKAIANLAGLAPLASDGGKASGKRPVRAGRARDPDRAVCRRRDRAAPRARLRRLPQALEPSRRAQGKVVRVALAHKLLVRLDAKAREVRAALPAPP